MSDNIKATIQLSLCLQIMITTLGYGGNSAHVWGPACVLSLVNLILVFDHLLTEKQNPRIAILNGITVLFFMSLFIQFFVPAHLVNIPSHPELQITYSFPTQNIKLAIYQWILPISAVITIPQVLKTEKDALWLLRCLVFVVLLQVGMGLVQYFLSRDSFLYQYYPFFSRQRGITGSYVTRNMYANILVVGAPLVLGQILHLRQQQKKIWFGVLCCFCMLFCVLGSKSRTGVFLYVVVIIGILFYYKHKKLIILLFMLGVISTIFFFPSDVLERFNNSGEDIKYRLQHYHTGIKIIRDHWLFGCGAGNFSLAFEMYRDVPVKMQYFHQDNDYIEFIAEYGILPSLAGILFLFAWGISIAKKTSLNKILQSTTLMSIIIFFVFATLHFPLYINANRLFLAYLMATLVAMSNLIEETT